MVTRISEKGDVQKGLIGLEKWVQENDRDKQREDVQMAYMKGRKSMTKDTITLYKCKSFDIHIIRKSGSSNESLKQQPEYNHLSINKAMKLFKIVTVPVLTHGIEILWESSD